MSTANGLLDHLFHRDAFARRTAAGRPATIGVFQEETYDFPKSQQAILHGGPARPLQSVPRRVGSGAVGVIVGLASGLGNALVAVNAPNLLGSLGAEPSEIAWVPTAYVMGTVSMNLLLVRFRQQFGLRTYAMVGLICFSVLVLFHLFVHSIGSAIAIQALFGIAAAPLMTLSVYYMMAALPSIPIPSVLIGLGITQLPMPLARMFSTDLLAIHQWQSLYAFELGLTLVSLGAVALLRLPPSQLQKSFEPLDFVTFVLLGSGVALVCAVLGLGTIEWWTSRPWMGWALAASIPLIGSALLIEHARERPLIDLGFISRSNLFRFAIVAVLGRIVLSDQSTVAFGLLNALGINNTELRGFSAALLLAAVAGTAASALLFTTQRLGLMTMAALGLVAVSAFFDAGATNLTRAPQLYFTQCLISFASTLYIGPALLYGLSFVLQAGGTPLPTFLVLFTITQNIGALLGSALLGSFQIIREKAASSVLTDHLHAFDPQVAMRLQEYAGALASTILDPAQRQGAALSLLQQVSSREANVLAYNNTFMLTAVLAAGGTAFMAGVLLLRIIRHQPIGGQAGAIQIGPKS